MSIPYTTGTVTLTQGQTEVAGNGTAWQTALIRGGVLYVAGFSLPIQTVISNTSLVAAIEWPGTTGEFDYAIVRDTDDARQQSANATILSQLLAELQAGTLFKYDVAGKLDELSTYDERLKDFAFLAVDQNPAQLFIKLSNASGDWSDPKRYAQGEAGPAPTIQFAPTITGAPGTPASATIDGDGSIDDPYVITFTLPAGLRGVTWRGAYTGATAYHAYDLVRDNGSIWIALQDTTGHAPPVLPTIINAWWELASPKGQDGTGIGDVVGPNEAVDGAAAMFDGTSGKLIKAVTPSQFSAWLGAVNGKNDSIFALEIADLKGRTLGMSGGVADAFDDQTGIYLPAGGLDESTISLLHFDGTNGSSSIVDSSLSPKTWAFDSSGLATISTAQFKFGGASAAFAGGLSGLYTPFPSDFTVGTGAFSVDMWIRLTTATSSVLFDSRSAANQNNPTLYVDSGGHLAYNSGNALRIVGTTVFSINTWYHVAVSRVAGVTRIFVNGVQEGVSYTDPVDVQPVPYIFVGYSYTANNAVNGYLDEFRLSNVGRYTVSFVPPTAAYFLDPNGSIGFVYDAANDYFYPRPSSIGGVDSNTLLMLHCDGVAGSTVFTDVSPSARPITANGLAQVSNAQSVFGGGSLACAAVTDYLTVPDGAGLNPGSGNFTIDFRVRLNTLSAINTIFSKETTNSANCYAMYVEANGTITFIVYVGSSAILTLSSSVGQFVAGQWYHLAVVRSGSSFFLFRDGILLNAVAAVTIPTFTGPLRIGRGTSDSAFFTNGYIDEFRFSNVARWLSSFVPPGSAYFTAMIDRTLGTPIGSLTAVGGLAAAFDGNVSQNSVTTARSPTTAESNGYVGKNFGVAPQKINSCTIFGATDCGYDGTGAATTITAVLRVKNGAAPSSRTDGVALGVISFADSVSVNTQTILSNDSATAYQYVWVDISSAGSAAGGIYVGEVQFFVPPPTSNMTLVSVPYTASAVPSSVRMSLQLVDPVTLVANTDFTMEASRDDGTTWTPVTLTASVSFNGIKMYEGVADVSGQPSGSTMRWRAKTLTNKNVIMSGVVEQWS